jgi:hypothetical protein
LVQGTPRLRQLPVADELLAFKLLLEADERRFLATAHRYPWH